MRNGRDVLDHRDLQANGLQRANCRLASCTRALHVDLNALQAVLQCCSCGSFGCGLSGKRSGFSRSLKAQLTGGSPGDRVTLSVGNGNDRVVEGRLNMNSTLFNILSLAALLDNFLCCNFCHFLCHSFTSSCSQSSLRDPCEFLRSSWFFDL